MPAIAMPVTKRRIGTEGEVGGTARISVLAAQAISAETVNSRRGSYRSARPRKALIRVPSTKPACTALVNSEAWKSSIAADCLRLGMIAVAENQSDSASTCAPESAATDGHLVFSIECPFFLWRF